MNHSPDLKVGSLSHIGLVRRENQDRMGHFTTGCGEIFVVADGMGGHKGGSQAATMVVEGLAEHLRSGVRHRSLRAALRSAAKEVNARVCAAATSGDPTTDHMGSTAVILAIRDREVMIGHLGDSRAYIWRAGRLRLVTRDHTWVQQLVDQKLLTEEEARNHPEASVLAHAFGRDSELPIELSPGLPIREGDAVLLCSDGLSGYLNDQEIAAVLARHRDPQHTAAALVEAALTTGGHDNITVQLVVFGAQPRRRTRRRLTRRGGIQRRAIPAHAEPPLAGEPAPVPPESQVVPAVDDRAPTNPSMPAATKDPTLPLPPVVRARRATRWLVAAAALCGVALLVIGIRSVLAPLPPTVDRKALPTPVVVSTPVPPLPSDTPQSLEETKPAGSDPTPTPTATPSSTPAEPTGASVLTGEVP
jgi:protein phosphatase